MRIRLTILLIIFAFILSACSKSENAQGNSEKDFAILVPQSVRIYKEAKGITLLEEISNDWREVIVLNKNKPEMELLKNNKIKNWYQIEYPGDSNEVITGWVDDSVLLFPQATSKKGLQLATVLYKVDLFRIPDSRQRAYKFLGVSDQVELTGYVYNDGRRDYALIIYNNEKTWAWDSKWLIPEAKIGVVRATREVRTEAKNIPSYKVEGKDLNVMDIVAVLPDSSSDFDHIMLAEPPYLKDYYIKRGAISFDHSNFEFSIAMNKDYYRNGRFKEIAQVQKVIEVTNDAVGKENPINFLKSEKIDIENTIQLFDDLDERFEEVYEQNSPASDLNSTIRQLRQQMKETYNELKNIETMM